MKGLMVWLTTMNTRNTGKGMELVLKMIGILIPALEIARYVFGIDISQQNRSPGFVFNDKISKGFNRHILGNLLPDNTTSSLFTPSCRALSLS
jgi:hypothetical protein